MQCSKTPTQRSLTPESLTAICTTNIDFKSSKGISLIYLYCTQYWSVQTLVLATQERSNCFLRNLSTFTYKYNKIWCVQLFCTDSQITSSCTRITVFQGRIKQYDSHLPCICSFIFSPANKVYSENTSAYTCCGFFLSLFINTVCRVY